jgi:cytochrome c-type biogenesis protein CcmH/NrfG
MTAKAREKQETRRQSQGMLVPYFVIFIIGFVAGVGFTVWKGGFSSSGGAAPPGAVSQSNELGSAILNLEAQVTAHPEDYASWVQLGNLYYDSDQADKAIKAYTKSLELHDGSADLLTDLGTMYRRAGQPKNAVEYFDKAIAKDPNHLTARFNKGVVLYHDLNDPAGGIASWEDELRINPEAKGPNGAPLKDFIAQAKKDLSSANGSATSPSQQ